ncbi:hypothetical protein VT84_05085 [Gemmata sp. SH-PL17]|uniref:hypothetical protein n=1 Tax=Gemmata sp. SH-PL17 TaxID=1630693 RepID=UPI0004B59770|nr:hypothetical protein [Gemmata sp. SH-PL17]AMV23764.1 hypothetical protein VT84_05085 [Gemmata sp. SH-PL17]
MAHVATLPWLKESHGLLVQFEYDAPQWFAIIHSTPDFSEAVGSKLFRLKSRLWAAGFRSDSIATLMDDPKRIWGLRIWGPTGNLARHQAIVRHIAVECGLNIFSEF